MRQVDIHKQIDSTLSVPPGDILPSTVLALVNSNADAYEYFFSRLGVAWIDWLLDNGFLISVKKCKLETPKYRRDIAELSYLVRVSELIPDKVADIITSVPADLLSPTTIERLLSAAHALPASQLARIMPKILSERWLPRLGAANQWARHEKFFKVLAEAGDTVGILMLSEAILQVRSIEEINAKEQPVRKDNPFYSEGVSDTKVFDYLSDLRGGSQVEALALVMRIVSSVIRLSVKPGETQNFIVRELFPFYDVDFFTETRGKNSGYGYREEVRQLFAFARELVEKLILEAADAQSKADIYNKFIATLPESSVSWRFRLFVLSLATDIFARELKEAFFKIFDDDVYVHITLGAEYEKALSKSFRVFLETDRHKYIDLLIAKFKSEKGANTGSSLFSVIWSQLTLDEKTKVEAAGFKIFPEYAPHASITDGGGGWVQHKSPISQEEFSGLAIAEIVSKMKSEWAPEKLQTFNKHEDFLSPVSARGIADELKSDLPRRVGAYLSDAQLFFEKTTLSPHYTYAFLEAVKGAFGIEKGLGKQSGVEKLILFLEDIQKSGERAPLEPRVGARDTADWILGWDSVHSSVAEVLKGLLDEKNGLSDKNYGKHREQLFRVLEYLLGYPDPSPSDEAVESAKIRSKSPDDSEYLVSDPLSTAINSVRGRAFECLVKLVARDWKQFPVKDRVKINRDVKKLYQRVLAKEETRALMFMYGHHLPTFYYADTEWINGMLSEIFPADREKSHLYLAAWEGYLTGNLFREMFFDKNFQELYGRGIQCRSSNDPGRKYFKSLEDGLSAHLALAFIHYKEFKLDSPLFINFWNKGNEAQHSAFVSFIGSNEISRNSPKGNAAISNQPETRKKLEGLWEWLLENYKSPAIFRKFGTWINHEKLFFEPKWLAKQILATLEKTDGILDWDYGLSNALPKLSKAAPVESLGIARKLFLDGGVRNRERQHFFHWDAECVDVLTILYANPETKPGAEDLIDDLIREGGGLFWKLKEILK